MRTRFWVVGACTVGTAALLLTIVAPSFAKQGGSETAEQAQIARGKYLVTSVAGCADCHTPMDAKGQPVPGRWLHGQKLPFAPLQPTPMWAKSAPDIAGLPGWTKEQAVHLLMSGLNPYNQRPLPPMPQYRMNQADATAVVAYLKSLPVK